MAWWSVRPVPMVRGVGLAVASLVFAAAHTACAGASTLAPPMLDITRQCDAGTRHNVTAMSECVVAESEARSEILQKWAGLSDASADKCLKVGRKSRRFPYSTIARCLAVEPVGLPPAPAPTGVPAAASAYATPADPSTSTFSRFKHFFTSGK